MHGFFFHWKKLNFNLSCRPNIFLFGPYLVCVMKSILINCSKTAWIIRARLWFKHYQCKNFLNIIKLLFLYCFLLYLLILIGQHLDNSFAVENQCCDKSKCTNLWYNVKVFYINNFINGFVILLQLIKSLFCILVFYYR